MLNRPSTAGSMVSLVLAAACWGLATVMSKGALTHIPPLTLLVTQLAVSITLLWSLLLVQQVHVSWDRDLLRLGLVGWLNPGISYTLSLLGLTLTTASLSTLLWATEPILILGLAWLILRERIRPALVALSVLAMVGAILAAGLGANVSQGSLLLGNALILAGALCCAVYTVLTRRMGMEADALLVVALQQTFAFAWALVIWPVELWRVGAASLETISLITWGWAVASGVVYYALAFWFYVIGLKRVSAALAGVFINLIPIFGISGAYVFLGERLSPTQWAGVTLILVAVFGIFAQAWQRLLPHRR